MTSLPLFIVQGQHGPDLPILASQHNPPPLGDQGGNLDSFLLVSLQEQIISFNVINDEVGQYSCAVESFLMVGTWAGSGWKGLMAQMHKLGF